MYDPRVSSNARIMERYFETEEWRNLNADMIYDNAKLNV